jgi:hypothetical protein
MSTTTSNENDELLSIHWETKHRNEMSALLERHRLEMEQYQEPSVQFQKLSLIWDTNKHTIKFVKYFEQKISYAGKQNWVYWSGCSMEHKKQYKISDEEYACLSHLVRIEKQVHSKQQKERAEKKKRKAASAADV